MEVFLPLQTGKGAKIRRFTVTKAHGGKAKAVPVQQREDETKECHKVFKSYTGNRLIQLLRYKHMLPFKKNEDEIGRVQGGMAVDKRRIALKEESWA